MAATPINRAGRHEERWGRLFVLLPVLQFFIFLVIPLGFSLVMSTQQWDILTPPQFVGGDNFARLFADEKFWKSLYNTVYLMLGIPVGIVLGTFLALMLNRNIKGVGIFRAVFYLPAIVSVVAASQMWMWIFNGDTGLVNGVLWNLFHIQGPYWFGSADTVKIPMIVVGVWTGLGPTMLFLLAGLQTIPETLFEAADLDGAGEWLKFTAIVIPKLTPTFFFLVIMGLIGGLQSMGQTFVMAGPGGGAGGMNTAGGPEYAGATMMFFLWQNAFGYFDMGYASATAWVVAILIFLLTWLNFKVSAKWVSYD